MNSSERHVLVLGAGGARGIGRGCAMRFLAAGYRVIVWDQRIEEPLPAGVTSAIVDVRDWNRLQELSSTLPSLHAAVNCIAIGTQTPIQRMSKVEWDDVIGVNLSGGFYAARWIHDALAAGRGTYVNLSSIFADSTFPNRVSYCVTKAALVTLTRCMAIEWARDGIRVVTVTPGLTKTGIQLDQIAAGIKDITPIVERTAQQRMVEVGEVANVIFQVTQPDFSAVTGANIFVDAGFDVLGGGFWGLDKKSWHEALP